MKYFVFLLLIPSLLLNVYLLTKADSSGQVKVIGVIDGDTLVLEGKSRVRLRQVDAPDKPFCGSRQAEDKLSKLAMDKKVRIDEVIPDQYGRGMALVWVGTTLINKELLASGWVRYHHDISSKTEELRGVSVRAQKMRRGIFGLCQSKENLKNPKCNIKGNIDKSTKTHIYYIPGCAQYEYTIVEEDLGEKWFCTEKEAAAAGYIKAKTCE